MNTEQVRSTSKCDGITQRAGGRFRAGFLAAMVSAQFLYAGFVHPGLISSKADLDFMRSQVNAGKQPWKASYDQLIKDMNKSNQYGTSDPWMTRTPKPHADFKCTDHGVPGPQTDLWNDAHAAYGHALLWYITRKEDHAKRAAAFMDAWSGTLKSSSWSVLCPSYLWPAMIWSAEILRSSYPGWPEANQERFTNMLTGIVWNHIDGVSGNNSNWGAWQIAAQMSIAVWANDDAKYRIVVERYKKHLLRTIPKDYGKAQETCRDLWHTQMGIAPLTMTAEIAWKQGLDLYSLNDNRLLKGAEYNGILVSGGTVSPDPGCTLKDVGKIWYYYYAIQNHYRDRKGIQSAIIDRLSSGVQSSHRTPWLGLTHRHTPQNANVPSVSIDSPADNSIFEPGDTVVIHATASHENGTIMKVAFYDGATLLGEDANAPYEWRLEGITGGQHTLRATAVDDKGETATASVNVKALAPAVLPGKLEAEDYAAMKGIQTETTKDAGGGMNVGWIDTGDWLEYQVTVASAGTYAFAYRVASTGGSGELELVVDGTAAHRVAIPTTGGWQSWTTVTADAELHAGAHTLRMAATGPDWNINYVDVSGPGATAATLNSRTVLGQGMRLTRHNATTIRLRGADAGEMVELWSIDGRVVARVGVDHNGEGVLRAPAPGTFVLKGESDGPLVITCGGRDSTSPVYWR